MVGCRRERPSVPRAPHGLRGHPWSPRAPAPIRARCVLVDAPPAASFPYVAEVMVHRCGTLDCHGSVNRNLRVYGDEGLRPYAPHANPAAPRPCIPAETTGAEVAQDYESVIALEPESMSAVVADHGANPERLHAHGQTARPRNAPGGDGLQQRGRHVPVPCLVDRRCDRHHRMSRRASDDALWVAGSRVGGRGSRLGFAMSRSLARAHSRSSRPVSPPSSRTRTAGWADDVDAPVARTSQAPPETTEPVVARGATDYLFEAAARAGYATGPIRGGVNPFGAGFGARVGFDIGPLYLGANVMDYLGGSDVGATDQALMFGVEVGYHLRFGRYVTLRPALGVGDTILSHGEPVAGRTGRRRDIGQRRLVVVRRIDRHDRGQEHLRRAVRHLDGVVGALLRCHARRPLHAAWYPLRPRACRTDDMGLLLGRGAARVSPLTRRTLHVTTGHSGRPPADRDSGAQFERARAPEIKPAKSDVLTDHGQVTRHFPVHA